jgi:hypothetical protein
LKCQGVLRFCKITAPHDGQDPPSFSSEVSWNLEQFSHQGMALV